MKIVGTWKPNEDLLILKHLVANDATFLRLSIRLKGGAFQLGNFIWWKSTALNLGQCKGVFSGQVFVSASISRFSVSRRRATLTLIGYRLPKFFLWAD